MLSKADLPASTYTLGETEDIQISWHELVKLTKKTNYYGNMFLWNYPELIYAFNTSKTLRPLHLVSRLQDGTMLLSNIYFVDRGTTALTMKEGIMAGFPIVIEKENTASYFPGIHYEALSHHFDFVLGELRSRKVDILTMRFEYPMIIKHESLLLEKGFKDESSCTLIRDLEVMSDDLIHSFSAFARYRIRYAMKRGVVVEIVTPDNIPSHLENIAKLWEETWKRSGAKVDKFILKDQLIELTRCGLATTFAAKYRGEYIAYIVLILDNNRRIAYGYKAPSSITAFRVGANHLLVYRTMLWSIENHFNKLDFQGIDCDPQSGTKAFNLRQYKEQFTRKGSGKILRVGIFRKYITTRSRVLVSGRKLIDKVMVKIR